MKLVIVGSMKNYQKYNDMKVQLEKKGYDVIIPFPDEVYSSEKSAKRKAMRDFNNHIKKSDAILVANFDKDDKKDYIGANTLMEIGMAYILNKKIFILNEVPFYCKEELEAIEVVSLKGDLKNLK